MDHLVKALSSLATDVERRQFLSALLTPGEIVTVENRLKIFMGLLDGRTQRSVRDGSHVCLGTVSHAARLLKGVDQAILQTVGARCNLITPGRKQRIKPFIEAAV